MNSVKLAAPGVSISGLLDSPSALNVAGAHVYPILVLGLPLLLVWWLAFGFSPLSVT